jgi:hypothetical protein
MIPSYRVTSSWDGTRPRHLTGARAQGTSGRHDDEDEEEEEEEDDDDRDDDDDDDGDDDDGDHDDTLSA